MSKVYCTNCIFLELRPTFAEIGLSGQYVFSGTHFCCNKFKEYLPYHLGEELLNYRYCLYGEQGDPHGYIYSAYGVLEQAKKIQCTELCQDTKNCSTCETIKLINKLIDQVNYQERILKHDENTVIRR